MSEVKTRDVTKPVLFGIILFVLGYVAGYLEHPPTPSVLFGGDWQTAQVLQNVNDGSNEIWLVTRDGSTWAMFPQGTFTWSTHGKVPPPVSLTIEKKKTN